MIRHSYKMAQIIASPIVIALTGVIFVAGLVVKLREKPNGKKKEPRE